MTQGQDDKLLDLAQEVFETRDGLKGLLEWLLNRVMGEEVTAHVGAVLIETDEKWQVERSAYFNMEHLKDREIRKAQGRNTRKEKAA